MNPASSISFIVVNYNSAQLAERCVASIRNAWDAGPSEWAVAMAEVPRMAPLIQRGRWEIIVVDNASPEGDAERLSTFLEPLENVRFIANDENVGFGAACNQAVEHAQGALIWMVNPDAVLDRDVIEGVLSVFLDEAEEGDRPRIGAVSPPLVDGENRRQRVAQADPSPSTYWRHFSLISDFRRASSIRDSESSGKPVALKTNRFHQADWLIGAALCVRREALDSLDGPAFDPCYFLYFEDADLCRRLREVGWAVGAISVDSALHDAQQSSGGSPESKRFTLVHFFRSFLRYAERWMTPKERKRLRRQIRLDMRLRSLLLPLRRSMTSEEKLARRRAYREIDALTRE